MKTSTKVLLLIAGLTAVSAPVLVAASRPGAEVSRRPIVRLLARRMAVVRGIARKLDLTAEQRTEIKSLRSETVGALKGIRADNNLAPAVRREKLKETVQSARKELRSDLNTDQLKELKQLREKLKARRPV